MKFPVSPPYPPHCRQHIGQLKVEGQFRGGGTNLAPEENGNCLCDNCRGACGHAQSRPVTEASHTESAHSLVIVPSHRCLRGVGWRGAMGRFQGLGGTHGGTEIKGSSFDCRRWGLPLWEGFFWQPRIFKTRGRGVQADIKFLGSQNRSCG